MNAYAGSRYTTGGFGRGFEEIMDTVAAEFRQAVNYVDRVIVPEVRHESAAGARIAARWLNEIADKLEPKAPGANQATGANEGTGL